MDISAAFDEIFKEFPKAREGNTLATNRPKSTLDWKRRRKGRYIAQGPRGGLTTLAYNERSNKITIARGPSAKVLNVRGL